MIEQNASANKEKRIRQKCLIDFFVYVATTKHRCCPDSHKYVKTSASIKEPGRLNWACSTLIGSGPFFLSLSHFFLTMLVFLIEYVNCSVGALSNIVHSKYHYEYTTTNPHTRNSQHWHTIVCVFVDNTRKKTRLRENVPVKKKDC
jgi:hypothetical protein